MTNLLEHPFFSRHKATGTLTRNEYVIVDIETTGLYPEKSEIIEIGAVKTEGTKEVDVFTTLIDPKCDIPEKIVSITGISREMTQGMPDIKKALSDFLDFSAGKVLVAHNSDFDIPFLRHHCEKHLRKSLNNKTICTLKIARLLFPQIRNHKLHTLAEHLGVDVINRHRAMGDCETTFHIWNKLIGILAEKGVKTIDDVERMTSLRGA
ncbi:MAG: 3'-5' exonuclease [Candidatus Margulisiibacteriota bacterium]